MVAALACLACVLAGPLAGSAAASPPINTIAPEVSGAPLVGEILVCHPGSWTGNATFTYVWLREGQEVEEGGTYIVSNADKGYYITCLTIAKSGPGEENEEVAESSNSLLIPGEHGSPPRPETLPKITPTSGSVGTPLTCSQGTWSGNPPPTFTYQWFRDESAIPNATSSSYTLVSEDGGHSISCKVTGTNSAGFATAISENSVSVSGTKLENTEKPLVLGSESPAVGESLTCSPGKWNGSPAPTFKYQWLREGVAISSATASIYTVVAEDETHYLSCKVTAENGQGSPVTVESSNKVKVPGEKPHNTEAPHIAGTVAAGNTVTCEKGAWTGKPTPTYTYLWLEEDIAIAEATHPTYLIPTADRGLKISCEVTGTNTEGTQTVSSPEVRVPMNGGSGKPVDKTPPEVVGTLVAGETATCNPGTWSGEPEFTYQWRLNKANIAGATEKAFQIEAADEGGKLSCLVTASNSEGSVPLESAQRAVKGLAPKLLSPPEVRGNPVVGETLTCVSGTWEAAPTPTFAYQWVLNGTTVGSTDSYAVVGEDRGNTLTCKVTASNGELPNGEASAAIVIPGKGPHGPAPVITGELKAGEALTCEAGTWTGEPAPLLTYQWLLEGVPISSATRPEYEITRNDEGRSISCEVTGTNSAGVDSVYSKAVRVHTGPPTHEEGGAPVEVLGAPVVGETLTCSRGAWEAKPAPAFSYEWLRDGSVIASGPSEGYKVELADQGHSFSCVVTATNPEGSGTAASINSITIPAAAPKPETKPPVTPPVVTPKPLTVAEILTRVGTQLTSVQRGAKIGSLLKSGATWFHFTAPASGTLKLYWYEVPKGAHVSSAKSKPVPLLVATTTATFSGATLKTVELRLTRAGRALLKKSKRITLTTKAVFAASGGASATWIKSFVLTR